MASGDRKQSGGGGTAGHAYQESLRAVHATDPGTVDQTQGLSLHNAAQFSFQAASSNFQASLDAEFLEKELEAWYRADVNLPATVEADTSLESNKNTEHVNNDEWWAWGQPVDFESSSEKSSLRYAMELLMEENKREGEMNLLNGNRYFGSRQWVNEHQSSTSTTATANQQGNHEDNVNTHTAFQEHQADVQQPKQQSEKLDQAISELHTVCTTPPKDKAPEGEEDANPFAQSSSASAKTSSPGILGNGTKEQQIATMHGIENTAHIARSVSEGDIEYEEAHINTKEKSSADSSHPDPAIARIFDAAAELSQCRQRMDRLLEGSDAAVMKLRKLYQRSNTSGNIHRTPTEDRLKRKKGETLTAADLLNMHDKGSGNPFDSVFTTLPDHINRVSSNVDKMRKLECSMVGSSSSVGSPNQRWGNSSYVSNDALDELRSLLEGSIRDLQTCEVDIQSLAETEKTTKKKAEDTEQWLQKEMKQFRKEFYVKFETLAEALRQFKQEFLQQEPNHSATALLAWGASRSAPQSEEQEVYEESPRAKGKKIGKMQNAGKSKRVANSLLSDAWYISPQIDLRFHRAMSLTPASKTCDLIEQDIETLRASLFGEHALEEYVNYLKLQNEKLVSQLSASEHEVRVARSAVDETKRTYNELMEQVEHRLQLKTAEVERLEKERVDLQSQNDDLNRQVQELQHTLQSQQQFRAHSNHSPYSNSTGETPSSNTQNDTSKVSSGATVPSLPAAKYKERRNTHHAYPTGPESRSPSNRPETSQEPRPNSVKGPTGFSGNLAGITAASRPRRATFSLGKRDAASTSSEQVIIASPAFTAQSSGQEPHTSTSLRSGNAPYKTPPSTMTGMGGRRSNERTFDTGFTLPANRAQVGARESKAQEDQPQTILQYLRQQNQGERESNRGDSVSQKSRVSNTTTTSSEKKSHKSGNDNAATNNTVNDNVEQHQNHRRPSSHFNEVFDAAEKEMNDDTGSWTTSSDEAEQERWSNPTPDSEVSESPKHQQDNNGEKVDDEGFEGVPLERLSPLSRFKVMHELKAPDAQFDSEKDKEE